MITRIAKLIVAAAWLVAMAAMPFPAFAQPSNSPSVPTASKTANAAPDAATSPATPQPSPTEIAAWLAQLDDHHYRVRERATQRLLAAGRPALEPLAALANGDRPEAADRAVWLLQQFGNAKETPFRRAALERLAQLKDRPQVVAAANDALSAIRHQEAKQAIEQLGGRFVTTEIPGVDPRAIPLTLILDEHWKGKHEDLATLGQLLNLRQVFVIGTELTTSDLAEMSQAAALDQLHLYGTGLEPADLEGLKAQLPQVAEIDYRRGGLLGVTGNRFDDGSPATAAAVQPGSAAARAGILVGDVIRRFDGQDVQNFKTLTEKISTHRAGDEVAIEVLSNGATKKVPVKLGQWSAENVIQQLNRQ